MQNDYYSARISHELHVQTSRNCCKYVLFQTVARSAYDDSKIHYVLPVLWMTSFFHYGPYSV